MKLTISRKLLFGYLLMALLTLLVSAYAIFHLQNLNLAAHEIADRDFILVETSKSMVDALLTQESTEKKYFIFQDPSLEQIFWQRAGDFQAGLSRMKNLKSGIVGNKALTDLALLHERYCNFFTQEIALVKEGRLQEAAAISDSSGTTTINEIVSRLKEIQRKTDRAINDQMNFITGQSYKATRMTLGLSLLSLMVGITLALLITSNISRPLRQLQKATGLIAEGNLDHQIKIKRNDEIGALANDFRYMTKRLKILEAMNLDASPLTGLPGNMAIENRIKYLLGKRKLFSLCQVDLDNFKPFADKYGYAWGSEVIKEVADILKSYVANEAADETFIGHIGGDDFVVIAPPQQAKNICRKLVADFEQRTSRFYDHQDAQAGYIIGKDRQGITRKFPLITVSAAIVTDDGTNFKNPLDMAMTAAELKEYAKLLPGSNFVTQADWEKHNILRPTERQNQVDEETN